MTKNGPQNKGGNVGEIAKSLPHEEDVDAYRTDDMKPPLEESQNNIAAGDSREDDEP